MKKKQSKFRNYLSLILLFMPGIAFISFIVISYHQQYDWVATNTSFLPWEIYLIGLAGGIATFGGVLDWQYHRNPLELKISKKERDAEAQALGVGGLSMFILMTLATLSSQPQYFLVPILIVLLYTTTAICYDEFVFHIHRCGKRETLYHRMLVFGNAVAWLAWINLIYA
ncbi:MAG: hypothetical protein AAF798_17235 [Bacteroidota bacterium]